jgi:hypothetical protein
VLVRSNPLIEVRLCESGAGFSWTSASMTSVIVTLRESFVLPLSTSQSGSSSTLKKVVCLRRRVRVTCEDDEHRSFISSIRTC